MSTENLKCGVFCRVMTGRMIFVSNDVWENSSYIQVNHDTGEYRDVYGTFISDEQKKAVQKKKIKRNNELKQDDFIWSLFDYCEELFPNIGRSNLTRLFYVATFVHYDSNKLTDDDGYSFLNKRQIKRKLDLQDKAFTEFWNEMKDNQILDEDEKKNVIVNTRLFKKGTIDKRSRKDFTRVYCNCVRYIYENCKNVRDHSKLSYIFKIIPYVNRKTNIVASNPEEMDNKKIKPMTIGEFCDAIKYNKSQSARLFKDLANFTVQGKHLMCYVSVAKFNISDMFIIMNPEIYYGGAEHGDAKFIFDVCDRGL